MNKGLKLTLIITLIVIAIVAFFITISLYGNPISHYLARSNANKHIEEHYEGKNLQISKVGYNPKFGEYYAKIESETSIDTRFELLLNHFGKIRYDSYKDNVQGGITTYTRLENQYNDKVKEIIDDKGFPYKTTIGYGTIKVEENDTPLKFDKEYNLQEIGTEYGKLVVYVDSKAVTTSEMKEIVLKIKTYFQMKGLPFRYLDLTIEKGEGQSHRQISIQDFPSSYIYEDGLEERLSKAAVDYEEYYREQDKLKESGNA